MPDYHKLTRNFDIGYKHLEPVGRSAKYNDTWKIPQIEYLKFNTKADNTGNKINFTHTRISSLTFKPRGKKKHLTAATPLAKFAPKANYYQLFERKDLPSPVKALKPIKPKTKASPAKKLSPKAQQFIKAELSPKPKPVTTPLGRFKTKGPKSTTTYEDLAKAAAEARATEHKKQQAAIRATLAKKLREAQKKS